MCFTLSTVNVLFSASWPEDSEEEETRRDSFGVSSPAGCSFVETREVAPFYPEVALDLPESIPELPGKGFSSPPTGVEMVSPTSGDLTGGDRLADGEVDGDKLLTDLAGLIESVLLKPRASGLPHDCRQCI